MRKLGDFIGVQVAVSDNGNTFLLSMFQFQ